MNINIQEMNGHELSQIVFSLRMRVARNEISYKEGKEQAEPYIQELNRRSAEIAKEFGRKPKKFQFAGFGTPIGAR